MQMLVLSEKVPGGMEEVNLNKILRYAMSFESEFDKIHIITSYNYSKKFDFSKKLNFHRVKWVETKSSLPGFFFHLLYLAGVFYRGLKILKNDKDIIVVTNSWGHYTQGILAVSIAKIMRRKSIVRVAGSLDVGAMTFKRRFGFSINPLLRALENASFNHSDLVISVSESILDLHPRIRDKTFIISDIFPFVEEFSENTGCLTKESAKTGDIKILYIGRLEPEKGVSILLEAMKPLNYKCTIVGDGTLRAELEKQAEDLGISDRVTFTGYLPQKEAYELICASDILVLPSFTEFTPNVLIEAMSIGTTIAASDVGGIKHLIKNGENGFTFKSGSAKELEVLLSRLANDSFLREEVSIRAKKMVLKKFSPGKIKGKATLAIAKIR